MRAQKKLFPDQFDYSKKSSQTTISMLRTSDVDTFEIPLPPLAEQRRIVAKIEELLFSEVENSELLPAGWQSILCIRKTTTPALHLGKAVHAALQAFHIARWRGGDDSPEATAMAFDDAFARLERDEGPVRFANPTERKKCRLYGLRVIAAYLLTNERNPKSPDHAWFRFCGAFVLSVFHFSPKLPPLFSLQPSFSTALSMAFTQNANYQQ